MTSDLYLDRPQLRLLSTRLRDIADWAADALDDTICRIIAHNRTPTRSGDRPLELNEHASIIADEAHGTLRTWAEHICHHSTITWPGEQRIAGWARFIDRHLIDLAKTEEATQAADELRDVHQRIMRTIDRPAEPEFVGPCQAPREAGQTGLCAGVYCHRDTTTITCRTCDTDIDVPSVRAATEEQMRSRLFTKAELRTALVMFVKKPVKRQTLDAWIRRGRLVDHGGGRYRLDEALALVATHHPRAS